MRMQIASDLHLEIRPEATFEELLEPGAAPVLALLGDVAPLQHPNLARFLEWCSEHWTTVLWVPGKMEIWGSGGYEMGWRPYQEGVDEMRRVASPFWNITVMAQEQFASSDGVLIVGCPLWKTTPVERDEIRALYRADFEWLRRVTRGIRMPVVVLTHVGPVPWMWEEDWALETENAMTLPDVELLLRPPIVAWAAGHCHATVQAEKEWTEATGRVGKVLLVSNPMGMRGIAPIRLTPRLNAEGATAAIGRLPQNRDYRRDAVLRIDPSMFRD